MLSAGFERIGFSHSGNEDMMSLIILGSDLISATVADLPSATLVMLGELAPVILETIQPVLSCEVHWQSQEIR